MSLCVDDRYESFGTKFDEAPPAYDEEEDLDELENERIKLSKKYLEESGLSVLVIGNPGAGKSTLMSNLSGAKFEAGTSFGTGLTKTFQKEKDRNNRNIEWYDTAGLHDADQEAVELAAKSINEAIEDAMATKTGIKLLFLCQLESGRARQQDLHVIKSVMQNIKTAQCMGDNIDNYSVVFNKVTNKILNSDDFKDGGKEKIEGIFDTIYDDSYGTSNIHYVECRDELMDKDNAAINDEEFKKRVFEDLILKTPTIQKIKSYDKIITKGWKNQIQTGIIEKEVDFDRFDQIPPAYDSIENQMNLMRADEKTKTLKILGEKGLDVIVIGNPGYGKST